MPAVGEHHFGGVVSLFDERVHVPVPCDALVKGVHCERTEAQAELLLLTVGQFLPAEIDHFVPEQGVANLRELFIRQTGKRYSTDLGSHGRGEGLSLNVGIAHRVVVESTGGMQFHERPLVRGTVDSLGERMQLYCMT